MYIRAAEKSVCVLPQGQKTPPDTEKKYKTIENKNKTDYNINVPPCAVQTNSFIFFAQLRSYKYSGMIIAEKNN